MSDRTDRLCTDSIPLEPDELELINAYWRAANYLWVGQIYLLDNPLLTEPLSASQVKPRLLGHWGTTPGLNLIYVHLNRHPQPRPGRHLHHRARSRRPRPGRQRLLENTYSEIYTGIGQDTDGLRKLAILVPRRHPQPCRGRDSRLHPSERRAGLRAGARLRGGFRQP
jgi:xylulose-5-phosphate/fructose-6-phosphate phosphoketolase